MIKFLLFTRRKIQMSEFSFEIKTSFVAEGLAFIHLSFMNIMTVYITNFIQLDYSVEQPTCLFCPAIYFSRISSSLFRPST